MMADTAEAKATIDQILSAGVRPHAEAITRIARDGDIAIVFYEAEGTRALLDLLRGGQRGPVVRLTRTRAMRICGRLGLDAAKRRWLTTRATGGIEKIYLVARGAAVMVNHDPQGRCALEGALSAEALRLLRATDSRAVCT